MQADVAYFGRSWEVFRSCVHTSHVITDSKCHVSETRQKANIMETAKITT